MSSDITMMIRLHPVSGIEMPGIGGTELLHKECSERPDLDLHYKSSPDDAGRSANQRPSIVTLGKNSLTMIADPTLPRNAVDVVVELSDDNDDVNDATPANDLFEGMGLGLRDTIRLLSDSSTFSFEPTPSSMEESPTTSQKHPKLRLRIQRYIAGFVAINNEVVKTPNAIIKEGDILSLQSMSYSYDYVVMLTPISDSTTNAATKTDGSNNFPLSVSPSDHDMNEMPPSTAAVANDDQHQVYMELVDEQQKLMQQMVEDEFTCAICLEYQVRSTALVPCGHSFCHTCIFDPIKKKLMHKVCSVCNTKITAVVPNRTIDSCFHLMVQFQSEQNKKQPDDEPTSSSLASILPQEDFDHYKVRSEEQTNVRMNAKSIRSSKRPRPTHHMAPPTHHRAPRLPPLPPPHLNSHGELYGAIAFLQNAAIQGVHMDDDDDNEEMHTDALQYFTNRLFPPQTPATATNQGQQPATASLVHGTTPSDAIEID